ncbi:hypothetical protein QAD02_013043 [Eretmocerus hayati]|uniref:Uncharacterized protein n=1 Tax=Eretmocerus hayati TaxID=131215 RepID=A0ACC2P1F4_9HYME|nr:hypothetical protein QAD02_013043 [Eretmocerus hayati]
MAGGSVGGKRIPWAWVEYVADGVKKKISTGDVFPTERGRTLIKPTTVEDFDPKKNTMQESMEEFGDHPPHRIAPKRHHQCEVGTDVPEDPLKKLRKVSETIYREKKDVAAVQEKVVSQRAANVLGEFVEKNHFNNVTQAFLSDSEDEFDENTANRNDPSPRTDEGVADPYDVEARDAEAQHAEEALAAEAQAAVAQAAEARGVALRAAEVRVVQEQAAVAQAAEALAAEARAVVAQPAEARDAARLAAATQNAADRVVAPGQLNGPAPEQVPTVENRNQQLPFGVYRLQDFPEGTRDQSDGYGRERLNDEGELMRVWKNRQYLMYNTLIHYHTREGAGYEDRQRRMREDDSGVKYLGLGKECSTLRWSCAIFKKGGDFLWDVSCLLFPKAERFNMGFDPDSMKNHLPGRSPPKAICRDRLMLLLSIYHDQLYGNKNLTSMQSRIPDLCNGCTLLSKRISKERSEAFRDARRLAI